MADRDAPSAPTPKGPDDEVTWTTTAGTHRVFPWMGRWSWHLTSPHGAILAVIDGCHSREEAIAWAKMRDDSTPDVPESTYYDIDGNEVDLDALCRREPAWAASRIRSDRSALATLRGELEVTRRERDEARAHELEVARAVGIVYQADGHAEHPGPRDTVLTAVHWAVDSARDHHEEACEAQREVAALREALERAAAWCESMAATHPNDDGQYNAYMLAARRARSALAVVTANTICAHPQPAPTQPAPEEPTR